MSKNWFNRLNQLLAGLALVLVLVAVGLIWARPSDIFIPDFHQEKTSLPKGAFTLSKQSYDEIAQTALSLKSAIPVMQLPDLRSHLTYYGANGRPDMSADRTVLYFALANHKVPSSALPGEKLYLLYDKKQTPARYIFSPDNQLTSLWIEANPKGTEVTVRVSMKNEFGEIIQEPQAHSEFTLSEKEFARFVAGNWEMGKWRVDGTLLARQKARWYGLDLFMERHGGEEFLHIIGKQRVDFGENEEAYSVFIAQGDSLVWEGERWKEVTFGEGSRGKPLLHVKKVDERLVHLELWDVEGKSKMALNLIKSTEPWMPQNILKDFKFMGARTRTQCVFEINEERILLKPQDWIILTESGWKKLTTPQEIDDYVNRKISGALFVFDGLTKKEDKQVLTGTMFNSTRTEMQTVELAVQQTSVTIVPAVSEVEKGKKNQEQAKVVIPKLLKREKG